MAEYIEREALQKQLNRKKPGPADRRYTDGWNDAVLMFKSMVQSAKAADVAPVRHGRWVLVEESPDGDIYECQWCGRLVTKRFSYCHCCGAKMDGGESNG